MNYSLKSVSLVIISGVFFLSGCGNQSLENQTVSSQTTPIAEELRPETREKTLELTVSIAPQKYFLEKIGGDRLKINVMVEPMMEPEIYEPKAQQLATLRESKAYIALGLPFEKKWLDKFKELNPNLVIIDATEGIEFLEMIDHGHDHSHEEESLDPHIWLSPSLVKQQAQNIYEGLVKIDPEQQQFYQENLRKFLTEIEQLDQEIRNNLAGLKNRKFIVFHPSWGYFAKDYNLQQISVEVDGKEPSASELTKLISTAKNSQIRVIFVQPEFQTKSAETIAKEIQGEVVMINPNDENWAENLLKVSQVFKETLQ